MLQCYQTQRLCVSNHMETFKGVRFTWTMGADVAPEGTDHCWRLCSEVDLVFCFLYQTLRMAGTLVSAATAQHKQH